MTGLLHFTEPIRSAGLSLTVIVSITTHDFCLFLKTGKCPALKNPANPSLFVQECVHASVTFQHCFA